MLTRGRILQCLQVAETTRLSQHSTNQTRTSDPLLPRPRRIRHTVRPAVWLFLFGMTAGGVTPLRSQTAPGGIGDDLTSFAGSPAPGTSSAGISDAGRGDATAPPVRVRPEPVVTDATAPLHGITITASRDTIYAGLEDLRMVLERKETGEALTVGIWLHQDQGWLSRQTQYREVYFYPHETEAVLRVHKSKFDTGVTEFGCIIAKIVKVGGQQVDDAVRDITHVISSPAPVVKLFVGREVFTDGEDAGQLSGTHVVAVMARGMPRGVSLTASIETRGKGSQPGLTATAGEDYEPRIRAVSIDESSFELHDDTWVGGGDFVVPILDDDLREGDETFEIVLRPDPELSGVVRYEQVHEWTECGSGCAHRVNIIDDEAMPTMDLSVSARQIMEEGETSSIARVSITDHVRFADERLVTLALGGTATMGADYTVSPADADGSMANHQVVLPARSTSAEVTLRAMSDDVDDPGEMIEVSAQLDGAGIGRMQSVAIMNQPVVLPKIGLVANRETIIGSMEDLVLTLTREGSLSQRLSLTIEVLQDQHWLPWPSCPAAFEAGAATATVTIAHDVFSASVVESGNLTLRVRAVDGYDTDDATATVYVVSQEGPAVRVYFDQETYEFAEDDRDATVVLVAEAAHGMPRGTAVAFSVSSKSGTAIGGEDFQSVNRQMTLREEDYSFQNGSWQVRRRMPVTLFDDQVREGDETCDLVLGSVPDSPGDLGLRAVTPVDITDDEDIPEFSLSASESEIREEDETSATAAVSIDNGKTFAMSQVVTFWFAGLATEGVDYRVSPADADNGAAGHQVVLAAGDRQARVMLTARKDDVQDPGEAIDISATHAGEAIGHASIRIRDHAPPLGPTVKVTFQGLDSTRDPAVAGAARGPFTALFTFSEPVRGFSPGDVTWQTHAETTFFGTTIGIHPWDFTEIRRGVEYSVRMMPTQNGRLSIQVDAGAATSVATGAASQSGWGTLRVEFPRDRLLVAPAQVTLEERGANAADFLVVLTSEPSGTVTVTTSGMEGTQLSVDRPTLTVEREYWTTGRGVTVTAAADADTRDETVTLTVSASGGGYDGRTATVVVSVRDNYAGTVAASDGGGEDEMLLLVNDVTPEAAAAALFGETGLSEQQLSALDHLGNGNGDYDLGDLLSWIARCRRGDANCGGAPTNSRVISSAALLAAAAAGRRGNSRRPPGRRDSRASGRSRNGGRHRRTGVARYVLAMLLSATMAWSCTDDSTGPVAAEPDPGFLTVELTVPPANRDIGVLLQLEGPAIEALRAPGLDLYESTAPGQHRIVVAGSIRQGPLLQFQVPDRGQRSLYRVHLLQVTGEDYGLRDAGKYRAAITD